MLLIYIAAFLQSLAIFLLYCLLKKNETLRSKEQQILL